jgi:hypothetical protein
MSQVPKARPECQGMSRTSPWAPRAARVFFVCILRCACGGVRVAVERGVCGVFCGANDNTLVLLAFSFSFSFCCWRMWIPISRGVSDLSTSCHRSRKSRRRCCVSFAHVLAAIWLLQQLLLDEQFSRNRRIVCTSLWSMWVFPLTLAPLNFLLIVEYDFWQQSPS